MRFPWAGLFCLIAFATVARPQKQAGTPTPATTTVSGHVFCADTNAPARMATVILQPAAAIDAIRPGGSDGNISSSGETSQTSMDGSFSIQHVAPGTYYVIASEPGYISPLAVRYMGLNDDPLPNDQKTKDVPPSAPRITVEGNLPVGVTVTIERGAAVSGTVLYDDGSPASGIQMELLAPSKTGWTTIMFSSPISNSGFFVQTDDQGRYRLSGLPAGKYSIKAQLRLSKTTYKIDRYGSSTTSGAGYSLDIYASNTTRQKDAEGFVLTPGEERRGVDIEIPVSKLHSVRGNIVAAHDGHVLNGGSLALLYPDDKIMLAGTSLSNDEDTFNFSFVPEGDYILRVDGASDVEYREISNPRGQWPPTHTEPHVLHQYGSVEQPIHITGDLSSVTIAAPDLSPQKTQAAQ
jgi:hypothetical protein